MVRAGFTLIELIIIIAILIVLAGIGAPLAKNLIIDAKATRVLDIVESIKQPCLFFYGDTAAYPFEDSGLASAPLWDAANHQLSMDPGFTGWQGPYIDQPLSLDVFPDAERIRLLNDFNITITAFKGFDLDGDDLGYMRTGKGNMLHLRQVSEELAKAVNDKLDKDIPGDWKKSGRVVFVSPSGVNHLFIFIAKDY